MTAALKRHLQSAYRRRIARWFGCRLAAVRAPYPIISFTFDDFPRSALLTGGAILAEHGVTATYYTSCGLAGQRTATGQMFEIGDLQSLLELGHELGCHTYRHCPAWETKPAAYETELRDNAAALRREIPGAAFTTHSFPISSPRPRTKRIAGRRFAGCRAGGQIFNSGTIDLNHLGAFFIEQSRDRLDEIRAIIDINAQQRGWLIFATHDVTEQPTRFGCTPEQFHSIVRHAVASGSRVLPVAQALAALFVLNPAPSAAAEEPV